MRASVSYRVSNMKVYFLVLLSVVGALASSQVYSQSSSSQSTIIVPAISQCRPGFALFNNQCIKSTHREEVAPEQLSCPPGHTKTPENTCIFSVAVNPDIIPGTTPTCPVGFVFNGVRDCVRSEAQCPQGYQYNPADQQCWPMSEKIVRPITGVVTTDPMKCVGYPCPISQPPVQTCGGYPCLVPQPPCGVGMAFPQPCTTGMSCPPTQYTTGHCPNRPVSPVTNTDVLTTNQGPVPALFKKDILSSNPPTAVVCPPGFEWNGHICVRIHVVAPVSDCPPYFFKDVDGLCKRIHTDMETEIAVLGCEFGFVLINGHCHKHQAITTIEDAGTGKDEKGTARTEIVKDHHILITNHINNPVNIHNVNTPSTAIDGISGENSTAIQTQKLSCSTGKCATPCEEEPCSEPIAEEPRCCEVVSPRMCRRRPNNRWNCYHRRTQQCGSGCTASRINIRPPRTMGMGHLWVMPPQMIQPVVYPPPYPPIQQHGKLPRGFPSI